MKLVEIRAAEGGDHSRRLVTQLLNVYVRVASKLDFKIVIQEQRDGYVRFRTDADQFFVKETGGHRWQGLSNGIIHTSTITVAALEENKASFHFDLNDVVVEYYKASGPGGQHKNKTSTACRLKCGELIVTCSDERSQKQNYKRCMRDLKARLENNHNRGVHETINDTRKAQIGLGERADKIRTYREKDDMVIDHRTGKKARLSDLLRGKWFD